MAVPLKDFRTAIDEHTDIALTAAAAGAGKDKAAIAREVLKESARRKSHEHRVFTPNARRPRTADGVRRTRDGRRRAATEWAGGEGWAAVNMAGKDTVCAWCGCLRAGPPTPACTCTRCGRGHREVHMSSAAGMPTCRDCHCSASKPAEIDPQ